MNKKTNAQHRSPTQQASEGQTSSEGISDYLPLRHPDIVHKPVPSHAVASALESMHPQQDRNLLRRLGLAHRSGDDPGFLGAILTHDLQGDTDFSVHYRYPRTWEPEEGHGPPCIGTLHRERHTVSIVPKAADSRLLRGTRECLEILEYEDWLLRMAGFRGNCEKFKVFTATQEGISPTDRASALSEFRRLPEAHRIISDNNPYAKPTILFKGWAKPRTDNGMDHDFEGAERWSGDEPITWLSELSDWLRLSGYKPALLKHTWDPSDERSCRYTERYFVMLVSDLIATQIALAPSYHKHRDELNDLIAEQWFKDHYLCKIGNLLVAESDRMPTFRAGKGQFCRALIFGAKSMVSGFFNRRQESPGHGGQTKTDADCRAGPSARGRAVMYGSAVPRAKVSGSGRVVDCGGMAADLLEYSKSSMN